MSDQEVLLELERARCKAVAAVDLDALRSILTEDYVHVHSTGKIDDLAGHFESITRNPRTPERRDIKVRVFGDAAVLIGVQSSKMKDKVSVGVVQQVAIRSGGRWRFVSGQITALA